MSIIPIALLSGLDLQLLGNNLAPRRRSVRISVAAVNRSLSIHGERVSRLLVRDADPVRRSRKAG
jgi:hypothetical protein